MNLSPCPLCSHPLHEDGPILRSPSVSQGRRGGLFRVIGSRCSLLAGGSSDAFESEEAAQAWWEQHRLTGTLNPHEDERRRLNVERIAEMERKLQEKSCAYNSDELRLG